MVRFLTAAEAPQVAALLLAGVPALAIARSVLGGDEETAREAARVWPAQTEVRQHLTALTGGVMWQDLPPEQRLKIALDKTYAEMAYFLWANNYGELDGVGKAKADTCRESLERKLAGLAGKGSSIDQLYEELVKQYKTQAIAVRVGKA